MDREQEMAEDRRLAARKAGVSEKDLVFEDTWSWINGERLYLWTIKDERPEFSQRTVSGKVWKRDERGHHPKRNTDR
jgi:hypothetical protein